MSTCRPTSVWCLKEKQKFYAMTDEVSLRTWERGKTACGRLGKQTCAKQWDFRWVKNNFRGHDISRPTPWASHSVPSLKINLVLKVSSETNDDFGLYNQRQSKCNSQSKHTYPTSHCSDPIRTSTHNLYQALKHLRDKAAKNLRFTTDHIVKETCFDMYLSAYLFLYIIPFSFFIFCRASRVSVLVSSNNAKLKEEWTKRNIKQFWNLVQRMIDDSYLSIDNGYLCSGLSAHI